MNEVRGHDGVTDSTKGLKGFNKEKSNEDGGGGYTK